MLFVYSSDVLQGMYKGQKVAVKSLLDDSHAAQTFLAEASIMTYVWTLKNQDDWLSQSIKSGSGKNFAMVD